MASTNIFTAKPTHSHQVFAWCTSSAHHHGQNSLTRSLLGALTQSCLACFTRFYTNKSWAMCPSEPTLALPVSVVPHQANHVERDHVSPCARILQINLVDISTSASHPLQCLSLLSLITFSHCLNPQDNNLTSVYVCLGFLSILSNPQCYWIIQLMCPTRRIFFPFLACFISSFVERLPHIPK